MLAARRADALATVAYACEAVGAETLTVATDVGIERDCAHLVDRMALAALAKEGKT